MITLHKLPYGHDIAFAIRDDDLSFFTDPVMIETIYSRAWSMGFKVSFAAVPNHKGSNNLNVPPKYRQTGIYYNIGGNHRLVEFLQKKLNEEKIELMQHGYCHSENENLPELRFDCTTGSLVSNGTAVDLRLYSEFYGKSDDDVINNILLGKDILEKTFDARITTFVAPQEYFSTGVWYGLKKANYDYCGSIGRSSLLIIPVKYLRFSNILRYVVYKLLNQDVQRIDSLTKISDIITIPATFRHYWNRYTESTSAEAAMSEFIRLFELRKQQNSHFILLTHYWEFFYDWKDQITQKRQLEYLNKILSFVQENSDPWKCSIGELIHWQKIIDKIEITARKDEIEIFSPFEVKGLSLLFEDESTFRKIAQTYDTIQKRGKNFVVFDINAGERKIICLS